MEADRGVGATLTATRLAALPGSGRAQYRDRLLAEPTTPRGAQNDPIRGTGASSRPLPRLAAPVRPRRRAGLVGPGVQPAPPGRAPRPGPRRGQPAPHGDRTARHPPSPPPPRPARTPPGRRLRARPVRGGAGRARLT